MKNYKVTFTIFGETRRANIKADSIEEAQKKLKEAVLNNLVITDINTDVLKKSENIDVTSKKVKQDLSYMINDIFTKFRGF